MSYFDDASLVIIPSGYKEDKVYSVKPIDGSGDLNFTRASSATRIGSTGLIEKTRTNLVLQSNQFDTTWLNSNTSETSGQSGYDGSSNAWLLTKTANAFSYIYQDISTSGVKTFSVYAKADSLNVATLYINASVNYYVRFNLLNGSVLEQSATGVIIDTNGVSVGNGWYRLSVTINDSITRVRLYPELSETTAGSIYIQDAQLEQGLVATSYIETTTTAVSVGSYDNVPRLNYTAGSTSSCPSLLLEPQRTNLVTHSEYINNSSYALTNATITNNSATSPEGVVNASLISITSSGSITSYGTSVGNNSVTFSIFAKQGTTSRFRMREAFYYGTQVIFDLSNGTIISGSGNIENYGNGWYRCSMTQTYTAGQGNLTLTMDSDTNPAMDVYLWGTQFEVGSYQSSYIPSYGATVTRVADNCQKVGLTSLIGQSEGTLFLDFVPNNNTDLQIVYQIRTTGGGTIGQIDIRIGSGNLTALGNDNGSTQFSISVGSVVVGTRYKCAVSGTQIAP